MPPRVGPCARASPPRQTPPRPPPPPPRSGPRLHQERHRRAYTLSQHVGRGIGAAADKKDPLLIRSSGQAAGAAGAAAPHQKRTSCAGRPHQRRRARAPRWGAVPGATCGGARRRDPTVGTAGPPQKEPVRAAARHPTRATSDAPPPAPVPSPPRPSPRPPRLVWVWARRPHARDGPPQGAEPLVPPPPCRAGPPHGRRPRRVARRAARRRCRVAPPPAPPPTPPPPPPPPAPRQARAPPVRRGV